MVGLTFHLLDLLDAQTAETRVAQYILKVPPREREIQSRRAFRRSHVGAAAACDFLSLPPATFELLHDFVLRSHDRRGIVHVNATSNPTADRTANQIGDALPGGMDPRRLHRDPDALDGGAFERYDRLVTTPVRGGPRRRCRRAAGFRRRRRRSDGRDRPEPPDHRFALHLRAVMRSRRIRLRRRRSGGSMIQGRL